MISVMDMTTGLFDSDNTASAARFESGKSTSDRDERRASLALHAGCHEHATARPLFAGMPAGVAGLDLDDFIARMTDPGG